MSLKNSLSVIFLSISLSFASGQNIELIRSIKKKLVTANGIEKFEALSDLSWEYRTSLPDSSIYYGQRAYEFGKELKIKKSLARPLNFIGIAYNYQGNNLNAFEFYNKASQVAASQNDSIQLAHSYNNLGRLFSEQGLEAKSATYFHQSLKLFKSINNKSGLAYAYQGLAGLYKIQNNFKEAEYNYRQGYKLRIALGNNRETMSTQLQLGKLYLDNHMNDEAIHYFQLADSTGLIIKDAIIQAEAKMLLAECLLNKGMLEKAESMSKDGLIFLESSNNVRILPEAYITSGRIQFKKNNLNAAKTLFTKALDVSTLRKDLYNRMEAYFFLWQTFKQQNNFEEELRNHNQYLLLKDSVKSLEAKVTEDRFNFRTEIERRKQENDLLKANEIKNISIILGLITISCIGVILTIAVWRNRVRIKRYSDKLAERNIEVKKINTLLDLKNHTLESHVITLLEFSRNRNLIVGNLPQASKDIAMVTAHNLNISRVSIWMFNDKNQSIQSLSCYELKTDSYLAGATLHYADCPSYFDRIKKDKLIVAHEARTHESTKDFTTNYFEQNNIYSLLDATFFLDGELKGLICCEQQDAIRIWSAEDIIFVSSIADVMSLAMRTAQRLEYEHHIKQQNKEIARMNEVLEERVEQRTLELEKQNKQLAEYAFINSHLLRGPLSRILGLINVIEHDKSLDEAKMIELLRQSGDELDTVVKKISDTLRTGGHFNRDDLT